MKKYCLLPFGFLAVGCATAQPEPVSYSGPGTATQQVAQAQALKPQGRVLKRKVAVGRFTNQTRYGRSLLLEEELDPLGRQTVDILTNRLVETGKFLVFERPDLDVLKNEQELTGKKGNLVGVDAIIVGSITEFGRTEQGKTGFLSATRKQVARAGVEIRLVDAKTGHVFFSANGSGTATVEAGQVAGFGSKMAYDGTLNDRAISAAIADVQNDLLNKLDERPWRTDILNVDQGTVFISGGESQGLKIGDELVVLRRGKRVKSGQTGFEIELPGTEIARIRIVKFFGSGETSEGSVAAIVSGSVPGNSPKSLIVEAPRGI